MTVSISLGDNKYDGLSNEQIGLLNQDKIEVIKRELVGFTQQQALHILECVRDRLAEQTVGVLDQLTVLS